MLKSVLRKLVPLCALLSVTVFCGCALTPTPVFLSEHEEDEASKIKHPLSIAVVVHDDRVESSANSRLCGIKRNTYMMPTSIAFLANSDTFDVILAKDLSDILKNAGYTVTYVSPQPPEELSQARLDEESVNTEVAGSDLDSIGRVQEGKMQNVTNDGRQDASIQPVSSGSADIAGLDLPQETDAVLYIDIGSFSSDAIQAFFFVSIQGWADMKAEVWDTSPRLFLTGTEVESWGTSGPRQIITDDCYTIAMNMSYQMAMDKVQEYVKSSTFRRAVVKARDSKEKTDNELAQK